VGYEMFLELMERTMSELKGEPIEPKIDPEIKVDRSAFIPESYVSAIDQRLMSYKRLAKMTELSEVTAFHDELRDRFGPLPEPAKMLIDKITLKVICRGLGIERLDLADDKLVLFFSVDCPIPPEKVTGLVQQNSERFRLTPDNKLEVSLPHTLFPDPIGSTKELLQDLS
jgi:transcription-repair coupling factor (superfamily II helicase)